MTGAGSVGGGFAGVEEGCGDGVGVGGGGGVEVWRGAMVTTAEGMGVVGVSVGSAAQEDSKARRRQKAIAPAGELTALKRHQSFPQQQAHERKSLLTEAMFDLGQREGTIQRLQ